MLLVLITTKAIITILVQVLVLVLLVVVVQTCLEPVPSALLLYTGDILALSSNHLDSLVEMPLGCGEQNMIRFAPSIYVLQYLDRSGQDNRDIRSQALGYMKEGAWS